MTDRNRKLVPDNWSLVRERALTTGLCSEGWYSEHSAVCRRVLLACFTLSWEHWPLDFVQKDGTLNTQLSAEEYCWHASHSHESTDHWTLFRRMVLWTLSCLQKSTVGMLHTLMRALTTGLCSEGWYSEHSAVCRRVLLACFTLSWEHWPLDFVQKDGTLNTQLSAEEYCWHASHSHESTDHWTLFRRMVLWTLSCLQKSTVGMLHTLMRALTTGLCSEGWYSEHSAVCRRVLLACFTLSWEHWPLDFVQKDGTLNTQLSAEEYCWHASHSHESTDHWTLFRRMVLWTLSCLQKSTVGMLHTLMRALTTGLCSQGWYSEHSAVCRRVLLACFTLSWEHWPLDFVHKDGTLNTQVSAEEYCWHASHSHEEHSFSPFTSFCASL